MSVTAGAGQPRATGRDLVRPALSIRHLSKAFRLPHEQPHTLKERVLHPLRSRAYDTLQAVDDVSFDVRAGEFFGIVGRNGSGKSTLLKCLAGIYNKDTGELGVHGRMSPFIELGVGFNPDLTARDNVIINAIMLGLSRKQALARFDDIVAFAELEEFMDLKLKNYSSGMQVRLAFSVAIQVDAEIVLIDEVLAVGDASFQQKCFDEFARLKAEGRTIIFVTHDMAAVEHFCDRAMLMERGSLVELGEPAAIARLYNQVNFRRIRDEAKLHGGPETMRERPVAEILDAWFEIAGKRAFEMEQGSHCAVRIEVRFHADTHDPIFAMAIRNDRGQTAFAASTQLTHGPTGDFSAGETARVAISFESWLAPGRYRLVASVAREGAQVDPYDVREDISSVLIWAQQSAGGIVDLPHRFDIRHG